MGNRPTRGLHSAVKDISAELDSEKLLEARETFKFRYGSRFEAFFQQIDRAIDELHRSSSPLPLFLAEALPPSLVAQLNDLLPPDKSAVAKELVSRRLERLPSLIEGSVLPLSIVQQYPTAVRYIIASITADSDASYGTRQDGYFDRDLRLTSGFTVPAGAEVVDLRCWLPRNFYRFQGLRENLRCFLFVKLRLGGMGPLFRIHLDTRHLADFSPAGRNECFARIAELLEAMPNVKGLVGTSWFYDAKLESISPHLRYLRQVPLDGGAFLRVDGPGEVHTRRATARSRTRERLYKEGKYLPVCATLVWPRRDLLSWSRRRLPEARPGFEAARRHDAGS